MNAETRLVGVMALCTLTVASAPFAIPVLKTSICVVVGIALAGSGEVFGTFSVVVDDWFEQVFRSCFGNVLAE